MTRIMRQPTIDGKGWYSETHSENKECLRFGCMEVGEGIYPPEFIKTIQEAFKPEPQFKRMATSKEVRVTSDTGGQKGSKDARIGSLDPLALMEVAKVAGFGEKKYARLNYMKGYEWSLSYDAMQRHLHAFWSGEDLDPESGLPHLAHAAWHCLALMAFMREHPNYDDRYKR